MDDKRYPPEFKGETHQEYVRRVTGAVLSEGRPTESGLQPLGSRGRRYVAWAKLLAKVLGILAPVVVSNVVTYRTAISDASATSQVVKDKAEAGYQVTRPAIEGLERRVQVLEEAVRRQEIAAAAQKAASARLGAHPRPRLMPAPSAPPLRVVPTKPAALPGDLDEAQQQVEKGMRKSAQRPHKTADAAVTENPQSP